MRFRRIHQRIHFKLYQLIVSAALIHMKSAAANAIMPTDHSAVRAMEIVLSGTLYRMLSTQVKREVILICLENSIQSFGQSLF